MFGGLFPFFLRRTDDVGVANITPIQKCPFSSSVANYRPISITSVLSKVFECLEAVRLGLFMEHSGVIPTTQFAYRKGLSTCNALSFVSHTMKVHWRVCRMLALCRLASPLPLIGSTFKEFSLSSALCVLEVISVFSILTQFLSHWSHHVTVNVCRSKVVNALSAVPQGCVLGSSLFLLYLEYLEWFRNK